MNIKKSAILCICILSTGCTLKSFALDKITAPLGSILLGNYDEYGFIFAVQANQGDKCSNQKISAHYNNNNEWLINSN